MKRVALILCIMLALTSVLPQTAATVFGEPNTDEMLNVTFSNGTADVQKLSKTGGGYEISSFDIIHGNCLKISGSNENKNVGFFRSGGLESGRYNFEFDMYCDGVAGKKYFKILPSSASDISSGGYMPVTWTEKGERGVSYGVSNIPDTDTYKKYSEKRWYNISVWVDTRYKEVLIEVDGSEILNCSLSESFDGISGFAFILASGAKDSVYLDNIRLCRESGETLSLSPLYIKSHTADDIIGNNFTTDNPPRFDITFTNRCERRAVGNIRYVVQTKDGTEVMRLGDETFNLNPNEEITKTVTSKTPYYGRLDLCIKMSLFNKTYIKKIPYTMIRHSADMPNNYRFGVAAHLSKSRGEAVYMIPLLKTAGIGWYRDEMPVWLYIEKEKGVYDFPKEFFDFLDLVEQNDINYMYLFNIGNGDVYKAPGNNANWWPPSTQDGYEGLRKYIKKVAEVSNGRIKAIEVWNEFKSEPMSGPLAGDPTVNHNLHRAIYGGVKDSGKNIKVVGIDEDPWAMYTSNHIEQYLKEMDGEKCFDVVSIHPYSGTAMPENGIAADFVQKLRALLKKYNQDENVPIWHSENGISDYQLNGDRIKQAAWTVRNQATVQAQKTADVFFNYNYVSYPQLYSDNEAEATFGILESYDSSSAKVPYLGKESYCAIGYYNGLMADNRYIGEVSSSYGDNVYIRRFKDRRNRDILMAYSADDTRRDIVLDLGTASVMCTDMYGNELNIDSSNGIINLSLGQNPLYIIGDDMQNPHETSEEEYYQSIVNDSTDLGTLATTQDGVYAHKYKKADGTCYIVLKSTDNTTHSLKFDIDSTSVNIADSVGRLKEVKTPDKKIEVSVGTDYVYIVSKGIEGIQETEQMSYSTLYANVCGVAQSGENIVVTVYNSGYSPNNVTQNNIKSAMYYQEQGKAKLDGSFEFVFPIKITDEGEKYAYVRCGNEENLREYKIYVKDNRAVTCELGGTNCPKSGIALSFIKKTEEVPLVIFAKYNSDTVLTGTGVLKENFKNGDLVLMSGYDRADNYNNCKIMFWRNLNSIAPTEDLINLNL